MRHYRFQQMRVLAKRRGKAVPSYDELRGLVLQLEDPFRCPGCRRTMNWLPSEGQATVVTLQHDRGGELRLLCRSCNTRHASFEGDSFYEVGPDQKRCWRCGQVKPVEDFQPDNGKRWRNRKTTCKPCASELHTQWTRENRDLYNAKQRQYRAKRKAAGNPVRGGAH